MSSKKTGVVLFQLGGPDSLESIEPFLYNLFCDPDIIDFPFARLARKPLAKLISTSRAKHVAHHYAEIGGRSPILANTRRQAEALERELRQNLDAKVTIAMRYWHPMTTAAIAEMTEFAPEELVLLPLYPQYSKTTTGSSVNEWNRCFERNGSNCNDLTHVFARLRPVEVRGVPWKHDDRTRRIRLELLCFEFFAETDVENAVKISQDVNLIHFRIGDL